MHLYVDANSGFLSGGEDGKKPPMVAKPGPPEKTHLHIKTFGPFVYDLIRDKARFDAPTGNRGALADRVEVARYEPMRKLRPIPLKTPLADKDKASLQDMPDLLVCDHLDLQFRRKIPAKAGAKRCWTWSACRACAG